MSCVAIGIDMEWLNSRNRSLGNITSVRPKTRQDQEKETPSNKSQQDKRAYTSNKPGRPALRCLKISAVVIWLLAPHRRRWRSICRVIGFSTMVAECFMGCEGCPTCRTDAPVDLIHTTILS